MNIEELRAEVRYWSERHAEWKRIPRKEKDPADEADLIAARHVAETALLAAIKARK